MSLMTSASNLKQFSLLGETNWQRVTSDSHIPFHGAYYSYFLLPFIVLFNYRVLLISLIFVLLNLITALVFFVITLKLFTRSFAALSLFFFLTSDIMIHHSLFPWIVNPVPLLAIFSISFVYKLHNQRKNLWSPFWLGTLSGLGFGMQNLYLPFAVLLFIFVLLISKRKLESGLSFLIGILIGSLPTIVFDFRHDFYHLRTFWQYFLDVLAGNVSGSATYYNFLYLYPFMFLALSFLSLKFSKIYKPFILFIPLIFIFFTFNSPKFNLQSSVGMPSGITLASLESASAIIAADKPPTKYNVITLWDFDTRAHTLRYLLTYYHGLLPESLEEYKSIDALYAFAPESYNIYSPQVYELSSFSPYKVGILPSNIPGYKLYKLTK